MMPLDTASSPRDAAASDEERIFNIDRGQLSLFRPNITSFQAMEKPRQSLV